jgi:hypothetical protein
MTKETNQIAEAIVTAARLLGNGNATTSLGAIEALGMAQKDALNNIAFSLDGIAMAIGELASAISKRSEQESTEEDAPV